MKKTLIAASVGALMLAAAGTASANSLLFPFFTTAAGATSILSISSGAGAVGTAGAATFTENLHYVYNYGPKCTHFDGYGKVSANDLLQHSVAAPKAGGFGKVVGTDGSTPFYFPLNDYGFLTVSSATTGAGVIFGDMAVADPATGLIASYAGISNEGANAEGDFSVQGKTKFNLSFYPDSLVKTNWYGVVTGDMSTAIAGGLDWTGGVTLNNGTKVFDNDENALSGNKEKALVCAGAVAPSDLMNSAQIAAVGPNGGLISATVDSTKNVNGGTGLVMTKLQVLPGKVVLMHTESGT